MSVNFGVDSLFKKNLNIKFVASLMIILVGLFISFAFFQENAVEGKPTAEKNSSSKAVIIDQLNDEIPNVYFQQEATKYLESAGYQVDLFTTKEITIDFYKNLPKMDYEFVLVRSHGATDIDSSDSVVLFSGERYDESKYTSEQIWGHVKRATPFLEISFDASSNDESEWVQVNETYKFLKSPAKPVDKTKNEFFAISPKLVDEAMEGDFNDTIFLLGGCSTLANPSMAQSLLDRGASTVIGWDDTVSSADNDWYMLRVLEQILVDKIEIGEAVEDVSKSYTTYPYPATLKHYP